ncbi:MAG: D-alanine--D-alanine ligase [Actinobacteria bacterium]|nr:D-alanine--D-alanine ligase [Actinomycetota bacterium]
MRLAILYGGRSAEHEVSVVSARSMMAAVDPERYDVVPIAITKSGRWLLPAESPAQLDTPEGTLPSAGEEGTSLEVRPGGAISDDAGPVDVVFPLLHGPFGEDGTVQGMLELAGIPYVGSGVLASAIGMDKEMQKRIFESNGMPVAPWLHVHAHRWERNHDAVVDMVEDDIGFPCFTKPAALGSSVGVQRCGNVTELHAGLEEALRHGGKALIERAVNGRELECAVLGNEEPEASVVGEIIPHRDFYDYTAKYIEEGTQLGVPANIPEDVSERIRALALHAFRSIDASGMARVDFFLESGTDAVYVNEINTIPGFTPISMYPRLWEASGVPYAKLIDRLVELALERGRS